MPRRGEAPRPPGRALRSASARVHGGADGSPEGDAGGAGPAAPVRYRIGMWLKPSHERLFPRGTFVVNAMASLLLGIAVPMRLPQARVRFLVAVGFRGALSTWSTPTYESAGLAPWAARFWPRVRGRRRRGRAGPGVRGEPDRTGGCGDGAGPLRLRARAPLPRVERGGHPRGRTRAHGCDLPGFPWTARPRR
ncbi:fluoride efflux transporter FluC [Streptomyces koyangensis]|uniref:fluoride efflux transporter FluC n=1 Tax=Streptomyces koyangensis TaxID=188770 RepID=UPI003C2D2C64